MKKTIKIISLIFALLLSITILACGSSSSKPIIVLDDESHLLSGNVVLNNSQVTSLTYRERGGARDGVFKWELLSDNDLSMDDIMITFPEKYEKYLTEGKVLSFDIYIQTQMRLCFKNHGTYNYLYNGPSDDTNVRFYSEFGGLLESGSIWGGSLTSRWLTIQVKLKKDFDASNPNIGITEWKYGLGYLLYNNVVYIDNIKIQNDFGA